MPKPNPSINRRTFLTAAASTAALSIVPPHVLGGPAHVPPSRKINLAYVGCGTQGLRQLMPALDKADLNVVAVCDPNRKSDDYPQWAPNELNDKLRRFLNDPGWAKDARGGLCGREVGRELVNRHYARTRGADHKECRAYADFRELLDKEKDLDALYVMTPEHLHGTIALRALRAGKHVISHKPLANVLHEARLARDTAKQTKAATHMFCASGKSTTPQLCEWIWGGAIGPVREVHNWSSRPFWP